VYTKPGRVTRRAPVVIALIRIIKTNENMWIGLDPLESGQGEITRRV